MEGEVACIEKHPPTLLNQLLLRSVNYNLKCITNDAPNVLTSLTAFLQNKKENRASKICDS